MKYPEDPNDSWEHANGKAGLLYLQWREMRGLFRETFAKCVDCSYCINKLMPELVFPFDNPNLLDVEAVHQILRDDF